MNRMTSLVRRRGNATTGSIAIHSAIHASCRECRVKFRASCKVSGDRNYSCFRECRECYEKPREEEEAREGVGRQRDDCEIKEMLCTATPLLHISGFQHM